MTKLEAVALGALVCLALIAISALLAWIFPGCDPRDGYKP